MCVCGISPQEHGQSVPCVASACLILSDVTCRHHHPSRWCRRKLTPTTKRRDKRRDPGFGVFFFLPWEDSMGCDGEKIFQNKSGLRMMKRKKHVMLVGAWKCVFEPSSYEIFEREALLNFGNTSFQTRPLCPHQIPSGKSKSYDFPIKTFTYDGGLQLSCLTTEGHSLIPSWRSNQPLHREIRNTMIPRAAWICMAPCLMGSKLKKFLKWF